MTNHTLVVINYYGNYVGENKVPNVVITKH